MPKRDGTGPRGKGCMTGKGRGYCIEEAKKFFINRRGIGDGEDSRENKNRNYKRDVE